MRNAANQNTRRREPIVPVMLTDCRVTKSFRDELFAAALRCGMTPTEYAVFAAAKELAASGKTFAGLFSAGDNIALMGTAR